MSQEDPFSDIPVRSSEPQPSFGDFAQKQERLEKTLEKVVAWINLQSQTKPEPAKSVPEFKPSRFRNRRQLTAAKVNGWHVIQWMIIVGLAIAVVLMSWGRGVEKNSDRLGAYDRAKASVKIASEKMGAGLYSMAEEIESGGLQTKQELGAKLKTVIQEALDAASDLQLRELEGITPWSPSAARDRILGAADGYSDASGMVK